MIFRGVFGKEWDSGYSLQDWKISPEVLGAKDIVVGAIQGLHQL
jgi:hypothetical protein